MSKKEYLEDAKDFENLRDEAVNRYFNNLIFIKTDMSGWHNALTAVCFGVGGVAIAIGADNAHKNLVVHPWLFWGGAFLLLFNGLVIFFFKKIEIEKESAGLVPIKQLISDLWSASKIARELADGKSSREAWIEDFKEKLSTDYDKRVQPTTSWKLVPELFRASLMDIEFGLLIFPILMLSSTVIEPLHIHYHTYKTALICLVVLYIISMIIGLIRVVNTIKKADASTQQVKEEIAKK